MDKANDPLAELLGPQSTLVADLRELHQHLVAANERLRERRQSGNRPRRSGEKGSHAAGTGENG